MALTIDPARQDKQTKQETLLSRRTFLKRAGGWLLLALATPVAYSVVFEPYRIKLERVEVPLSSLPPELDGLRIGLLADLHAGHYMGDHGWQAAVTRMREEAVDLILIAGDLVHDALTVLGTLTKGLSTLRAPLGCFAVLGNHDYYARRPQKVVQAVEQAGITMLVNAGQAVPYRGARLWLAGLDDPIRGRPDLERALAGRRDDDFTIALVHGPDFADVTARYGIPLQLSGHSHGGQVRLPLIGAPYLPRMGRRYPIGLQHVPGSDTLVYTSRGIGLSGPPVRLNAPPEITVLTLRKRERGALGAAAPAANPSL